MEIAVGIFAIAVAATCFLALVYNDIRDTREAPPSDS